MLEPFIDQLRSRPNGDTIAKLLSNSTLTPKDLAPYAFKSTACYTRNLIYQDDHLQALILCWGPGHETPLHDHNGATGWMLVVDGLIAEDHYRLEGGNVVFQRTTEAKTGEWTEISDDIGLHIVANRTVKEAMTLHIYSPTIAECTYYDPKTSRSQTRQLKNYSEFGKVLPENLCADAC